MAEIKKINGNTLCDDVARDAAGAAKTAADKALAKATVQPDWNESDPTSPAYIKNRIGGYKRSEEERRVVITEDMPEVTIDGSVYKRFSDTLVYSACYIGARWTIGQYGGTLEVMENPLVEGAVRLNGQYLEFSWEGLPELKAKANILLLENEVQTEDGVTLQSGAYMEYTSGKEHEITLGEVAIIPQAVIDTKTTDDIKEDLSSIEGELRSKANTPDTSTLVVYWEHDENDSKDGTVTGPLGSYYLHEIEFPVGEDGTYTQFCTEYLREFIFLDDAIGSVNILWFEGTDDGNCYSATLNNIPSVLFVNEEGSYEIYVNGSRYVTSNLTKGCYVRMNGEKPGDTPAKFYVGRISETGVSYVNGMDSNDRYLPLLYDDQKRLLLDGEVITQMYTAGKGIAISDTGEVSADVSEIKTYTDEALSALVADGSNGRKMLKGVLSNAFTRKYGFIYPPLGKGEWGITRIQEPDDESVDGIRFSFGQGTDELETYFSLLVADNKSTIGFPTSQHFALEGVVQKKSGYSLGDVLEYEFNEDDQTKKMTLLRNDDNAEGVVITTKHSMNAGSRTTLITTAIKLRSSRKSDDDGVVLDAIGGQLLANGRNMDFANPETNATEFYLKSSTADSTKRFKITVTDDGTLAATEVV